VYTAVTPTGIKDTFYNLIGASPNTGPITIDINTTDSCGNPSFLGESLHTTMHLKSVLDTCKYTFTLSWTPYIGWKGIKKHYILEDFADTPTVIDSVGGGSFQYSKPYLPNKNYKFFIRAIKDTSAQTSSTSNMVQFSAPNQQFQNKLSFDYVSSIAPIGNSIEVKISPLTNNVTKEVTLITWNSNWQLQSTQTIKTKDILFPINTGLSDDTKWYFSLEGINWCGDKILSGDTSVNIIANVDEVGNSRLINWNTYFTWNNGIDTYEIKRGTGDVDNIVFTDFTLSSDTFFSDSDEITEIGSSGICYQITAIENLPFQNRSKSNVVCVAKSEGVFVPNAFVPNGINNFFKPEGVTINYEDSEIEIYNRWGQQIYHNRILMGWDGKAQGKTCETGVYLYKLKIIKTNNEIEYKTGTVSLLR